MHLLKGVFNFSEGFDNDDCSHDLSKTVNTMRLLYRG